MNYLIILLSLVLVATAQARTCNTNITPDTPTSRFILNKNGTAFDKKTGLTWMRCALGQTWDSAAKTCAGTKESYRWKQALNAAEAASFAGFSDWRLPNVKELNSILEGRCSNPAINLTVFPQTSGYYFWSSSNSASFSDSAWIVNFSNGHNHYDDKSYYNAVRLVRSGQ